MHFTLKHAVGNRERWQTRDVLTQKSALWIADQVAAIEGITGVSVNHRTGSVIMTMDTYRTKLRIRAFFASLQDAPPVVQRRRQAHQVADDGSAMTWAQKEQAYLDALEASRQSQASTGLASYVVNETERAFNEMPVLTFAARIKHFIGDLIRGRSTPEHLPQVQDDAKLDFTELIRYVVVRPFLPMVINIGNAVLGSIPYLIEGCKNLLKGKINVSVLDSAAILISLIRLDFKTVGLVTLLLGLGEMLERYTRKKSLTSLTDQLRLKVETVWVRHEGQVIERNLHDVTSEDTVVVRSGSVIPVDGIVVAGDAAVNQATMTGEPIAVHRTTGSSVFAGTVVEDGEIDIRPTAMGDESRLSKIIQYIENSEAAKASIQGKAERLADAIVPFNFLLAGLVWLFTRDLTRTASVLMVDYSCALRLATPLAILTAMRVGSERGVLVKGGKYLEALAQVDTVVFDKTGTLTSSQPELSDVVPIGSKYPREELLRLAACLEEHFPHPVSRAITRKAAEENVHHVEEAHDTEVKYIVAHGICSSVDGVKVILGSRHFVEDDEGVCVAAAREIVERLAREGKSILYLAVGGELAGVLGIEDPIRDEAPAAIAALRARGVKRIVMLTGDDERTAASVARTLGLDGYVAQVIPQDKAEHVARFKAQGAKVLMVGDGINDAPALSQADVAATLRDGTDIAQEVADVVLTRNSLLDLPLAIDLGRASMARIKQNFAVSVGLNTAFLAGGLAGVLMPTTGALLHNATTIGVCLNAMQPPLTKHRSLAERLRAIENSLRGTLNHLQTPASSDVPSLPAS